MCFLGEEFMLEKNYSYLYNPLAMLRNPYMRVQTEKYALETCSESNIGISALGFICSRAEQFERIDFSKIPAVQSLVTVVADGKKIPCSGTAPCYTAPQWYWSALNQYRIIEAGRFVNKFDMMYLCFGESALRGRFEIFSLPDSFTVTVDCIVAKGESMCDLQYEMRVPDAYTLRNTSEGAELSVGAKVFYIRGNDDTLVHIKENSLIFSRTQFTVGSHFAGLSATFYAGRRALDRHKVEIGYQDLYPQGTKLHYDPRYGVYEFILPEEKQCFDYNNPAERNIYDRILMDIVNPSNADILLPLCFRKDGFNVSITGMSPMIRDGETGEHTGESVQITKDWHIHPDNKECAEWFACDEKDPRRLYEGKWSRFYTVLKIPAKSNVRREYTCAYENWGKYCAVSHAQLSLIGWGGYHIWEQTAFGSHGETICYQMDESSQCGSMIADIRPLYTVGNYGQRKKYEWSGNVGGGEFLRYERDGKRFELCDVFVDFFAQSPVLAETRYRMRTEDEKISCSLTVNEGRTTDAVSIIFNYRFDFNDNFSYDKLEYFNFPSVRYARKMFELFAYGNGKKITDTISLKNGFRRATLPNDGNNVWFFFYGVPDRNSSAFQNLNAQEQALASDQNANVLLTVRRYAECVNGHTYYEPNVVLHKEGERCILSLASRGKGRISKGNFVELCLELTVLPQKYEDFYGQSFDFDSQREKFNTPEFAYRISTLNAVTAEMARGTLIGNYPLIVRADEGEATFRIKGGRGLVNVRAEGFADYRNLLFLKNGKPFDDGVHGADFWQVNRLEDGTYAVSVSLDNSGGDNLFTIVSQKP